MQWRDDTTLPSRGQCQDRASEDRFGCKIEKVRREHIESLYPPVATDARSSVDCVLVPIRKVSNQKFQYFRPSSSWCSFSFASCRRLPKSLVGLTTSKHAIGGHLNSAGSSSQSSA